MSLSSLESPSITAFLNTIFSFGLGWLESDLELLNMFFCSITSKRIVCSRTVHVNSATLTPLCTMRCGQKK